MTALSPSTLPVALSRLCSAMKVPRSTVHRRRRHVPRERSGRRTPSRALLPAERQAVLEELHSERFVDSSPAEVVHALLADGRYLASERTMYPILTANNTVKDRRNQRRHPEYKRPELMATKPNEVWSWDITRLRTAEQWVYLYLYVVLDIFSRAVVGWMVAAKETATLASPSHRHWQRGETSAKHDVQPGTLVLHADRATQMTSKSLAQLLADLVIASSHSRPQVSDDNPFFESQFKTMKCHSSFPGKFTNVDDAVTFGKMFFHWYNNEHRHSGIAYLTPNEVHEGRSDEVLDHRYAVRMAAFVEHPERYPRGAPRRQTLASAVYINPTASSSDSEPSCVEGELVH